MSAQKVDHVCLSCQREFDDVKAPTIHDYEEIQPFGCDHRVYFFLPTHSAKDRPCYCNDCARVRNVCMRCGKSMRAGAENVRDHERAMDFAVLAIFILFSVGVAIVIGMQNC